MSDIPFSESSPLPLADPNSAPHWEALKRGELALRRCVVCRSLNHPIAETCRVCDNPQLAWETVAPDVRLYSWVIETRPVIRGMTPPYTVAQVTPAECQQGDVRLIGTILGDTADLEIGMPLRLRAVAAPESEFSLAVYERT